MQTAIPLTDPSVSTGAFDSSYEGLRQISVSAGGFRGSFTVSVSRPVELTGIEVEAPAKNYYLVGEDLDLTKGKLRLIYSNDTETVLALDEYMVSGYNKDVIGTQAVQVAYNGFTASFNVNVYGKTQYAEIIKDIEQNEDGTVELAEVQVPMNVSDPWLVMQAVKIYGLRPGDPGQAGPSGSYTWKGWPISCVNILMQPGEFCRIRLQLK